MKKIVYQKPDGGIAVVHPAEGARLAMSIELEDGTKLSGGPAPVDTFLRRWPVDGATVEWAETEEEFLRRIAAKDAPSGASIVDAASIPTDRTFRDAWKIAGTKVDVDMEKAREIHRERLRAMRAPRFVALDIAYLRADESGDVAAKLSITATKQELRDVPAHPSIAAAKTPEELKAAIPEVLK